MNAKGKGFMLGVGVGVVITYMVMKNKPQTTVQR